MDDFKKQIYLHTGFTPFIHGKYFEKRMDLIFEFRKLLYNIEENVVEILYFFQDNTDLNETKQQLDEFREIINNVILNIINQKFDISVKNQIIIDFYQKICYIQHIFDLLIQSIYPIIEKTPSNWMKYENIDMGDFFQDLNPNRNKGIIVFEKFRPIATLDDYGCLLTEELVDEYDKYVSTVNTIIYIRQLMEFKGKFEKNSEEYLRQEELLTKEFLSKIDIDDEKLLNAIKNSKENEMKLIEENRQLKSMNAELSNQLKLGELQKSERKLKHVKKLKQSESQAVSELKSQFQLLSRQKSELEKEKEKLEQNINALNNKRIDFEKEIDANCNDLSRFLNEARNKEDAIQSLLHKRKRIFSSQAQNILETPNNEEQIEPTNINISEMNSSQKEEYFNTLINDRSENKFNISIQQFYNLTNEIQVVNEDQFKYMIDYYNYLQSQGNNGFQIIFSNLKTITIPMLKRILSLNNFSVSYLSEKALKNILERVFLYDENINDIGELLFLNENLICNEEKFATSQSLRDNLLKKAKRSFYSICTKISNEVRIKEGTTRIESYLFNGFDIDKVFIPSTVLDIQDNAFYQCRGLTTVSFEGANLTTIGKSAFSGCDNLKVFIMPRKVKVIEESTFNECKRLEQIQFSQDLEEIKDKAFYKCKSLREVMLPSSLKKLGESAFSKCKALKFVSIPGVLLIHPHNFSQRKELNDDSSVQNFVISAKCFKKCRELENVIIEQKCQLIDNSAFESCSKIEKVTLNLTNGSKIEKSAFLLCEQLKSVHFIVKENASLEICDCAFQFCKELVEIKFDHPEMFEPNALKVMSNVFNGCEELVNFSFPENCENMIGESCFLNCTKLKTVLLPKNITIISKAMFKNCKCLVNIDICKNTLTSIENEAFENCIGLKLERLPENLVKIGDNAFRKCALLKVKNLPPKIEYIGQKAFENCRGFVEIVIPESMKKICKKAFDGCSELEKVVNNSSSVVIEEKSFYNCIKLKEVHTDITTGFSPEAFKKCAKGLGFYKIES